MKFLVTFLLCLAAHSSLCEKVRYDQYKLYKFTPTTAEAAQALAELQEATFSDYDFWSSAGPIGLPVQIMVPPYKIAEMERLAERVGLKSEVLMDNVQDYIDDEERHACDPNEATFGWDCYHTLSQINNWLVNLSEVYNDTVELVQVNGTYEGRQIVGVKLDFPGSNATQSVFVESTIHAREWITAATSTYILNQLLTNPNVTELAQKYTWYFFPVFNPDGYVFSHDVNRMWRKTRVPHSVLCIGADPNRNWDYEWGVAGTSNSPCTEIYRGPQPFSEPSCLAMSKYIEDISSDLLAYISFHSFSQLLLIPFGYTPAHLQNYNTIKAIGRKAMDALYEVEGTNYTVGTVYETIYPAAGSSADWVKGKFNTSIVYTYELRDTGLYGFLLPPIQIIPTAVETFVSFVAIFEEYEAYDPDN